MFKLWMFVYNQLNEHRNLLKKEGKTNLLQIKINRDTLVSTQCGSNSVPVCKWEASYVPQPSPSVHSALVSSETCSLFFWELDITEDAIHDAIRIMDMYK